MLIKRESVRTCMLAEPFSRRVWWRQQLQPDGFRFSRCETWRQNSFRLCMRLCVCFSLQDCFTFSTAQPGKTLFTLPGPGTCCNMLGSEQCPLLVDRVNPAFWPKEKLGRLTIRFNLSLNSWGVISTPCALFLPCVRWEQAELNWLSGWPPADWLGLERHPLPPTEWREVI